MVERDRSQQDARRITDLQLAAGPIAGRCGVLFAQLSDGAQRLFEGVFEVCDLDPVAVGDNAVDSNDIEIAVHSYPLRLLQCTATTGTAMWQTGGPPREKVRLLRPHESPPSWPSCSQGITARTPDQFARNSVHNGRNPANTMTSRSRKLTADQGLEVFHGRPITLDWRSAPG